MITVKLQGGLGNQMFQYAMGKALAKHLNTSFSLDLTFLLDRKMDTQNGFTFRDYDLDVFQVNPIIASENIEQSFIKPNLLLKLISVFKKKTWYKESCFHFDDFIFNLKGDVYIDGYWQSPLYFQSVEKELRKDFLFVNPIEDSSKEVLEAIRNTDSICVNVRRGDFLDNDFHGVCSLDYYQRAVLYMTKKVHNPHLFVFSDDMDWCIEKFKFNVPITFVTSEHDGVKYANKLHLMASCKHFIIPNSTFAWWAVWLSNRTDHIVIAPKKWFSDSTINTNDLIPLNWIRLEN